MKPVASIAALGPFAGTTVELQVSPCDTRLLRKGFPTPGRAPPRAPVNGLLLAVMPLSEAGLCREDEHHAKADKLTLCDRTSRNPNRCTEAEAPAQEATRRDRSAMALWTPAPLQIERLYRAARQDPVAKPWPELAAPNPCTKLEKWRLNRDVQQGRG